MKRLGRGPLLWIIVVALLLLTVTQFVSAGSSYKSASITTIMNDINSHHVRSANVQVSRATSPTTRASSWWMR